MVGNGHCVVYGCTNDQRYPVKYVIKDHISAFDGGLKIQFWSFHEKHFSTCFKQCLKLGNISVGLNILIFAIPSITQT